MKKRRLPIIDERTIVRRPIVSTLLHVFRVIAVGALLALLPSPHFWEGLSPDATSVDAQQSTDVVGLTGIVKGLVPDAQRLSDNPDEQGLWTVFDFDGNELARIARTLPMGSESRGYRGPTEALLLLDAKEMLCGVTIIDSHDTEQHVDAVASDRAFLDQFKGLTWGGVDSTGRTPEVDGVSGATLTSLAMAEGVFTRLGKPRSSLLFREPLTIKETQFFFPDAATIKGADIAGVLDSSGTNLGTLVRTGQIIEGDVGYQGPTELIIAFDMDQTLLGVRMRSSYDNEPYVKYVRDDSYFWSLIEGKDIDQLASWDLDQQEVEGVSGATMTSMAVARTLRQAANRIEQSGGLAEWTSPRTGSLWSRVSQLVQQPVLSAADFGTMVMLGALLIATRRGWMRRKRFRLAWMVTVVLVIGFWSGNLISIALVTGWASSGVSWHLAVGLVSLCAIAFVIPPTMRGNPYCNHLCPHGAIQQLIRPGRKSKRQLHMSRSVNRTLSVLPPLLLVAAYLVLLFRPSADVTKMEPFHAYLWPMASTATVVLAVATIAVTVFIPMGYCKFGCPTGFLIGYLRRTSLSHRFLRADLVLTALLIFAIGWNLISSR